MIFHPPCQSLLFARDFNAFIQTQGHELEQTSGDSEEQEDWL